MNTFLKDDVLLDVVVVLRELSRVPGVLGRKLALDQVGALSALTAVSTTTILEKKTTTAPANKGSNNNSNNNSNNSSSSNNDKQQQQQQQ